MPTSGHVEDYIDGLSEESTPDTTNDMLLIRDATDGSMKKIAPSILVGEVGATQLDDLNDVNVTTVVSGELLTYDGTEWINTAISPGIATLDELSDVSLITVVSGELLTYNGAEWINSAGVSSITTLDELSDITLTTPASGQGLLYNGIVWNNTEIIISDHDHSGNSGDGGTFDAANLTAGASTDGQILTSDGAGGVAWEDPAAGSGDVATDAIWDATGDLAVGTGVNTASKFGVGANGTYLRADSGEATGLLWSVNEIAEPRGRITLTSGTPITTSNVTAATTVYYCPYRGNRISLYDGVGIWEVLSFTEKSIKLTDTQNGSTHNGTMVIDNLTDTSQLIVGMEVTGVGVGVSAKIASIDSGTQITTDVNSTADGAGIAITFKVIASKMLDIFCYNNSGTAKLSMVAWTNDTTRATALTTQDGIYVLTGDTTKRYIGSVRTTTTAGQTEDSLTSRFTWNYDNRVIRKVFKTDATSHSYAGSPGAYRYWNNDSTQLVKFICGVVENIANWVLNVFMKVSSDGNDGAAGINVNAAPASYGPLFVTRNNQYIWTSVGDSFYPVSGYNYVVVDEYVYGTATYENYYLSISILG